MNRDNAPKESQIHSWSKEIEEGVGDTLRREKPVGESETPVLEELNPPKNLRVPRRSQEIANGGSWATLTVVLEERRVKSEGSGEGIGFVWGLKTQKLDSPISKTGQFSFT
jgi:hypothetical protein